MTLQHRPERSANLHETPGALAKAPGQESYFKLSIVCYHAAEEIIRRTGDKFPGLLQRFKDNVVLTMGGAPRGELGHYAAKKWEHEASVVDEIHVNFGHIQFSLLSTKKIAHEIVTTIAHELVHLFAEYNSIQDSTGRGGRYHNKRFAELAERIHLKVERSPKSHIGYTTPGLTEKGIELYADLLQSVENEIRLIPHLVPSAPLPETDSVSSVEPLPSKYVSAQCSCVNRQGKRRTIRIATGWWQPESIGCVICLQYFSESPPDGTRSHNQTFTSQPEIEKEKEHVGIKSI